MNNKLEKIIYQARLGNELPFNGFLKDIFLRLRPKLVSLTNSDQETEEIFLLSMQKFWERFVINEESLPQNPVGYVFIMCKNAWLMSKRHPWNAVLLKENIGDHQITQETSYNLADEPKEYLELEWLKKRALSEALDTLSPKCRTLMQSEIDPNIRLKDLQKSLGFNNYQALVQAKYNCKKRLIKKVYEVFDQLIAHKR